jgi:copper(I)-binding protein
MSSSATERPRRRTLAGRSGGRWRTWPVLVAAGLLCAVLTSCDAGQLAETATETPDTAGVDGGGGAMVLDDVFVQTPVSVPAGGSVALRAALTDQSPMPDRLVAVTTPAATSVELLAPDGTPAGAGIVVPGQGQVDATTGPVLFRLTGLTANLSPQAIVPITFEFEQAGHVTIDDVPVAASPRGP